MKSTIKVVAAFEEADNRYNEGWSRSRVVAFLQEDYEFTEPEAKAIVIAIENIRSGVAIRFAESTLRSASRMFPLHKKG